MVVQGIWSLITILTLLFLHLLPLMHLCNMEIQIEPGVGFVITEGAYLVLNLFMNLSNVLVH